MNLRAAGIVFLFTAPAFAEPKFQDMTYICERDVAVPVVYISAPETSLVMIHVEGGQYLLYNEPAASGARYRWPSGGSSYVWWTKGDEATLYWKEGEAGKETAILTGCKPG